MFHDVQIKALRDARHLKRAALGPDEVFYVVHRITAGDRQWFQHNVILADGLHQLATGICDLQASAKEGAGPAATVSPVLLHCLRANDPDLRRSATARGIRVDLPDVVRNAPAGNSVVYGLFGGTILAQEAWPCGDVLEATLALAETARQLYGGGFTPLSVALADQEVAALEEHLNTFHRVGMAMTDLSPTLSHTH